MTNAPSTPTPPNAAVKPTELTTHGHTRIDNYYWLNDRENPDVIDYLKAENEYLEQVLAPVKDFREQLFDRPSATCVNGDNVPPNQTKGSYA